MGENAHRTVKELLEQNENSPLTLRLALTGLLPLDDSVSFHQQKILSIHFPCAALSVLQGNRNQKRSPWYVMDFRILTAVTSQRLLYRLRKKSKVLEKKKKFFLDRVKSIKSVWPTSVALILHRLIYMLHFLYWVLTFTVIHKEKHMNQCLQGHSQLSTKCKF